jgi:ATP-dependent DNA helicase 2 subunit 1
MSWGEELESQYLKYQQQHPVTSTLAKRPAASRKGDGEPPAKKAKAGAGGIDDVRQFYQAGNLQKVGFG